MEKGNGYKNHAQRLLRQRGKSLKLPQTPSPLRKNITRNIKNSMMARSKRTMKSHSSRSNSHTSSSNGRSRSPRQPKIVVFKPSNIPIFKVSPNSKRLSNQTRRALKNIHSVPREKVPKKLVKFLQEVVFDELGEDVTMNNFEKVLEGANV
jgi:hypothetical protein